MLTNKTTDGASAYVPPHDGSNAAAKFQAEYMQPPSDRKAQRVAAISTSNSISDANLKSNSNQNSDQNCIVEFAKSTVNAAIIDPTRAIAQIIDNTRHSSYDKQLQSVANSFGLTPAAPAEFGTARYFGQQLGNAVGMMVPFLLIRGAGGKVAGSVLERGSLAKAEETCLQAPTTMSIARKEALASGATGLTYGTFFRTTEDQSSKNGFWEKRFHQGAADMATFGVLGFTSPFVAKSLNSMASSMERSAVASSIESSAVEQTAKLAGQQSKASFVTTTLAETVRSPITSGVVSSVPAGLWNAEMQARQDGRWAPTGTELKENLVGMAFIGGAFGGAHSLYGRAARSKDVSPALRADDLYQVDVAPAKPELQEKVVPAFSAAEISTSTRLFQTSIAEGNWKHARELFEAGAIDPTVLKDEAFAGTIRSAFDAAFAANNWEDVTNTLRFGVIPPEHFASPANKEKALKNLSVFVGEKMEKHLDWVLESKILSENDLRNSADLRRTTQNALQYRFSGTDDASERFNSYSWVDAQMRHDAALGKLEFDMQTHNFAGVSKLAQKIQDLNLATDAEVSEIGRRLLPSRVSTGDITSLDQFGNRFFGPDWAQEPTLRAAAEQRIEREFAKGSVDTAEAALGYNLVAPEFMRSEPIQKAAQEGFGYMLREMTGSKQIAERYEQISKLVGRIPPDAARPAAVEGLRKYFFDSDYLREYRDMVRDIAKIEFTSDELRASARQVLTESLQYWDRRHVNRILELQILTPDDLKDAVAAAIPRSIAESPEIAAEIPRAYEVDGPRIVAALHDHVAEGNITNTLRTAMLRGAELNSALGEYLAIPKLTHETGKALYERLRREDPMWSDRSTIVNPFEIGATEFGAARMLRFALNPRVNPHDTMLDFHHVVSMYRKSGLTHEAFEGKILSQVWRDSGVDDIGSSYAHLQAIAKSFPDNPDSILERARKSAPELKALADSIGETKYGAFEDWNMLKKFGKLQHLLEQQETLDKLNELTKNGQPQLAAWLKTLMFHPDSRIPLSPIMQFWQEPEKFLALDDSNSGRAHGLKKPSNYTDIPNLDLTPTELRDALLEGTLDKLQVFAPMRIEYDLAPQVDLSKEFDVALGARRESRQGTAKNSQKLFSEVSRLLKADAPDYSIKELVGGKEPPANIRERLTELLYHKDIGVPKPEASMKLIAELHRKSDPVAILAGDDTVSCMGFGTGKNNIYMFNPNDAQFTVRIVNQEGKVRTFAQSVLTKDKDVKQLVPEIIESMQSNNKAHAHDVLSSAALRSEPSVVAADNVEVHPKYYGIDHQMALEAVYVDFFSRYLKQFGEAQNLRTDKIVIGLGYTDAMKSLPQEPNTYVPQAPVAYSDKTHENVYRLDMDRKPQWTATPTKIEILDKPSGPKEIPSAIEGIAPLTFEDTLPVAWLESKAYQDNPLMIEGVHNMENSLIAQAISNTAKGRPNMSLKYSSPDGTTQGYLLAYEGKYGVPEDQKPVIFVSDYSTDRSVGRDGLPRAGRAGGKLLQGFMEVYKREYLDKGNLVPVLANARAETSYKLLLDNLKVISKRLGYEFDVQVVGTHQKGTSILHDVLIVPRKS